MTNGESSFWHGNWSSLGVLCKGKDTYHNATIKVKDLHSNEAGWNLEAVQDDLLVDEVSGIWATKIFLTSEEDEYIWQPSSNGKFSLSSAHGAIRESRIGMKMPSLICWESWKERNSSLYQATSSSQSQVIHGINQVRRDLAVTYPMEKFLAASALGREF
ncbi:hypothetical protein ACH5RR_023301 [Cinchona calisaya]|uniref:Uncharacterized protein n=1 Tax=Cinchona calisaya TaxID=153742 RepID=A0ABD2ZBT4_9GENT